MYMIYIYIYVCVCVCMCVYDNDIYIVGFICKLLKEYKFVNLIITVDQNNQEMILIHRKYGNVKYMESQLLWKYENMKYGNVS